MGEYADLEIERILDEPRLLFYSGRREEVEKPKDEYWRCQDGRVIKFTDMETKHIKIQSQC